MRKIIAVVSALVLVGCIAIVFYGCGADDKDMTTTTPSTSARVTDNMGDTDMMDANDGIVTDVSGGNDDGGVLGDIVTDVSEGISDAVTDISEDVSKVME